MDRSEEQNIAKSLFGADTPAYNIIGVDESGSGPICGPVVAVACFIEDGVTIDGGITSKGTIKSFDALTCHNHVKFAYAVVSNEEIDELNIEQATLTAMTRALKSFVAKYSVDAGSYVALVDGNKVPKDMPDGMNYNVVVQGEKKCYSIAAASTIAKVLRDRIMIALDKEYPMYNLAQHKGYPTEEHRDLLIKYGASDIHRKSFKPVKKALRASGGVPKVLAKSIAGDIMGTKKKKSTAGTAAAKKAKLLAQQQAALALQQQQANY